MNEKYSVLQFYAGT